MTIKNSELVKLTILLFSIQNGFALQCDSEVHIGPAADMYAEPSDPMTHLRIKLEGAKAEHIYKNVLDPEVKETIRGNEKSSKAGITCFEYQKYVNKDIYETRYECNFKIDIHSGEISGIYYC